MALVCHPTVVLPPKLLAEPVLPTLRRRTSVALIHQRSGRARTGQVQLHDGAAGGRFASGRGAAVRSGDRVDDRESESGVPDGLDLPAPGSAPALVVLDVVDG